MFGVLEVRGSPTLRVCLRQIAGLWQVLGFIESQGYLLTNVAEASFAKHVRAIMDRNCARLCAPDI
eukprot:2713953-Amphidinium_carterae.1